MADEDHFCFVINCYNNSGLRKTSNRFRKIFSVYILFPILIVFYGMVIFNIRFKNNNIFEIAEVFESVSTFGQLVTRKAILLMHRPLFEEIIDVRSQFWNYDRFGKDQGDKFRKMMAFSVSLIKNMWFASIFSLGFHFCTPFFVANSVLPDACWIPAENKWVIFLLGSFDALFLCMCTDLKIQFSLLNKTIQTIGLQMNDSSKDNHECWEQLKKCSRHHNFLLQVHRKVSKFFSEYFVCQYLINVGGVCIQFFIINDESSNLTQILRSVVYILIASLLSALIFIPSSIIEEEADIFQDVLYNSNWQNTSDIKIRKFVLFWIMKSQESIQMSGAGFFRVNRNVLIQIPRLAFSIATVLGNIK